MKWMRFVEEVESICECSKVAEAFEFFRKDERRALLVVVNAENRPIGVLREGDLKKYVYASYGRELIRNKPVSSFCVECPTIADTMADEEILSLASENPPVDGYVVVCSGEYVGMLKKDSVIRLFDSHRKNAEQQILQLQRIESLGTLAGGIAHELNNLLMPIIGNAEIGAELAETDSRVHTIFGRIRTAAFRAGDIVRQILVFSRPDLAERKPLHLTSAVDEGLALVSASLPSTVLVTKLYSPSLSIVLADSTQIQQALLNLCANGAHAMNNAGILRIAIDEVDLSCEGARPGVEAAPGRYLRLSVIDDGCGIPPAIRSRILEPFFTTKEIGKGTGLGLSVVAGIVRSHGGFMEVESEVGCGSTFSLYFPRAGCGEIGYCEESRSADGGTGTVLIVDDEEAIVSVMREYLTRLGYVVLSTTSSVQALELFKGSPKLFDLVITDHTMPLMTGEQLIARIRALRPDVPIILCSGNADLVLGLAGIANSADEFLHKPVSMRQIAHVTRKMLERKEPPCPSLPITKPAEMGQFTEPACPLP